MMTTYEEYDYTTKLSLSVWKKIFTIIISHKKYMILLILVMISAALVDAVIPLMSRYAVDNFIVPRSTKNLTKFIFIYIGIIVFQSFIVWLLIVIAGKIETGICYDIRKNGFRKLQDLSFSYYDKTPVGWIMARMTSDTHKLGEIISWGIVEVVWGGTIMIAIALFMFYIHWKLALVSLSVVPVLFVVSMWFQQKILKSYRLIRKTNSKITGAYNEGILGAKTTKTLVREMENLKEFTGIARDMRYSSVRAAVFSALYLPIVLTLGSIGTALALWVGGNGVFMGVVTYGTLVAFLSYTIQFFEPIRELARIFAELMGAQASAERILSMIETDIEIKDTEKVIRTFGTTFHPIYKNWPDVKGNIKFRNVSFRYTKGGMVLDNFNLSVKAGETIALVGETGSGKSTIVNLVCRFYEPVTGKITIDGVDYKKRSLLWLHSHIGYVLQTPHLFSGTILENIKYGNLHATDDEIKNAAKIVFADQFIQSMEKGYDTEVGEGGSLLSTGQKQLLSFARAIIARPALLILDEATSSIDVATEKLIQSAVSKILANRTSFIIAHRLSTVKSADRIIVLKNGAIYEEGNHETLMDEK
ncbi:MAG: ABC transporter ATP-binding protein, partial [Chitinispirillia bacterium]